MVTGKQRHLHPLRTFPNPLPGTLPVKISRLIWCELLHRKLNVALALLAVMVAVACSVGLMTVLRSYQLGTEARVKELDDEIRKITKNM